MWARQACLLNSIDIVTFDKNEKRAWEIWKTQQIIFMLGNIQQLIDNFQRNAVAETDRVQAH